MKLDDAISKRRSIRKFSSKKAHWGKVIEAIDAAIKAPFTGNVNNLQFIIVSDQKAKNRIAECCQQDWVADATFIIAVCSDYKHLKEMYQDRAEIYGRQHAGAAIENFLLKITDLKLASCWIGSFIEDLIKDELKIPENIEIEALLPVGYKAVKLRTKSPKKASLDKSMYWGKWKQLQKPSLFKDPLTW